MRTVIHYHNEQENVELSNRKIRQVGWIDNLDQIWDMTETNDCMHQERFGNMAPVYVVVGID